MNISCIVDVASREVSFQDAYRIASYDHNVDVIRFSVEPIEGFSLDLSSIRIAAKGPNKARHDYPVDPSTVAIEEETGYITFDWPIPAGVTEMPEDMFGYGATGQLIFAVCAEIISGSTVSKAWHSDDGIITVVAHLEPESGGGEDPEEEATNAQKIAQLQTDVAVINTQVGALANGSPTPVATVAEMTDESAVYLYTGSETGYTAGNWYFWNGSAWTSGGQYGGAVTDSTLSIEGAAADAKAVGDALAGKADADDVTALDTRVTGVETALNGKVDSADVDDINERLGYSTESTGNMVDIPVGRYQESNGTIANMPTSVTIFGLSDMVLCEPNTEYTVTFFGLESTGYVYVTWFDAEHDKIQKDNKGGTNKYTVTSPENAKYIHAYIYKGGTGFPDISTAKIQIEEGAGSSEYVPPITAKDAVARTDIARIDTTLANVPTNTEFNELETQVQKNAEEQDTGIEHLYGVFQNGGLSSGQVLAYAKYRVATNTIMTYARPIKLIIANGYRIGVHFFENGVFSRDSGWQTGSYDIPAGAQFKCVIGAVPEDTSITADIDTFVNAVSFSTYTQEQVNDLRKEIGPNEGIYKTAVGKRYVCHWGNPFFSNIVIPSQSRFDIERARKAGFNAIELNVQTTSDGKFIVGHGNGGNFGTEFYNVDGDYIAETAINSVTLNYIKTKIRLNSAIEKYRVAPLTLEEALLCCKLNGLVPAVSANVAGALTVAEKIMGKDNYIVLVYTSNRPEGFNGVCASWLRITDKDALLAKCNASGGAYVAGLDVTNSAYANFTLSDWKEITELLHANGYKVSASYVLNPILQHTLEQAGFDYLFAGYQAPEIENGNICNLDDNNTFSDFTHNGTVTGGKLVLASGQTVEPSESYPVSLSSGGSLHVSFVGSITVSMGMYVNNTYTITSNDDTEDWWFSTYFNGVAPTFKITASANTTISTLSYKASKY